MGLVPGTQVGPYEIQAAVGAGGVGQVYRARDAPLSVLMASLSARRSRALDKAHRGDTLDAPRTEAFLEL